MIKKIITQSLTTVFFPLAIVFLFSPLVNAQINILNSNLSTFNITPSTLCEINIANNGRETQVILEARLLNSNNEVLISVKTNSFLLRSGLNVAKNLNFSIQSSEFSSNAQSNYIKTSHSLPTGLFHNCYKVIPMDVTIEGDDFCDDIESDLSSFLFLVSPPDKETIETQNPLLLWSHNEDFSLTVSGEYYRIILVQLNEEQTAEAGITVNNPTYMKNYLSRHEVQYPFDAKELKKGGRYGWQVQKMSSGVITNKTEAWEFTVMPDPSIKENKYAVLKKTLDAGYYTAENNKVFFKFDEEYSSGKIVSAIYNSKRELVLPKLKNENLTNNQIDVKQNGYNQFEINLNELNVKKGMHTLEVKNEKGESFLLKFFIE